MSKKIANRKQKNASVVEMDAGKFLRMINSGARSQIVLFEERIRAMGQQAGSNWHLVSLDNKSLVFEDIDSHKYFTADIARLSRGRVKIDKVQEVRVVESKKEESFQKNLKELIDNISEDNSRQADSIFNRIAAQRFRSKVIPESNRVTTRDGITRHVNVARTIISDSLKPRIIRAVCEALTDSIRTKRGRVVEATFADRDFEFPISELTRRRVVARKMKQIAGNAYLSEGFQSRIQHICSLVCKKEIKEAVKIAAEFLVEEQEFSLLNLTETRELIGFTLAAQGILNEDLSKDVGLLFYSTNCKINRETIINDWKETARMTEYSPLVENVRRLEGSENFDKDYQSFLRMVFKEDMTTKQAKAKMYLAALKEMKHVLSGGPDQDLVEGLDEFIVRLESAGDEVDDATLMEVEAMVAATSENLLKNVDDLSSFRDIPGEPPGGDLGPEFGDADLSDEAGLGGLGGGGMGDMGGDMGGGPELPLGDEEGLGEEGEEGGEEDLLGVEDGDELSDEDEFGLDSEDELLAASQQKRGQKPILEGKCKGCGASCEDDALCECGYTESKDKDDAECESRVAIGGVVESKLRMAVKKLNSKQLALELHAWKGNAGKFFAEDGTEPCTVQLMAYIDRARYLKSKPLFEGFKRILIANTPVRTGPVSSDPYAYEGEASKIDREYGLAEDHKTWPDKMKQSKEGGQIGSKETARAKGDAMGSQEKETDHLQTMKGGIPPNQNKKKTGMEGFVRCTDCEGMYDITECMTRDGAVCPECGSDMHNQLMEELSGAGHQMDRIGNDSGGVAATSLGTSDGCKAGGTKDKAGGQEGKGIATKGLTKSDGRKAGGSKDKMDGQEGSSVSGSGNSGKVKGLTEGEKGFCKECGKPKAICGCPDADEGGDEGEVEEDQFKSPTRRRRHAWPSSGRDSINPTEAESRKRKGKKLDEGQTVVLVTDDPVDQVVSNIASQMTGMGGDEMGEIGDGMGDEMGDEMDMIGDEMPPDDDEFGTMGGEEGTEGGEGGDFEDMGDEFGGESSGDEYSDEGAEGLSDDDEFGGSEGGEGGEGGPPFESGAEDEGGEEEEEEEVEEGTLPPALEKFKKKKKGESDDNDNSESVDEECCSECGCPQGECTCAVKEDNNITIPTTKEYDSETAARNDGDGKAMTKKPKFKETDVAGRKNIGPARSAGG